MKPVEYMKTPLTPAATKELLGQLGVDDPRSIMRKDDAAYKYLNLDSPNLTTQGMTEGILFWIESIRFYVPAQVMSGR